MADAGGKPIVPTTIEGLLIQLQRRLNEVENRERGMGRRGWQEAQILLTGVDVLDNGFPGWRMLNDGRIELRGRIDLKAISIPSGVGTPVLRLPGRCAPPGDGSVHKSWLSTLAPRATSGTNNGVYRLDVQRTILPGDTVTDPDTGLPVVEELIYADILAYPPGGVAMTDWIGFDHAIFDPQLYIDTLAPVSEADHNRVFGRGYPRDKDGAQVVQEIPGEFGIAIVDDGSGGKVAIVPGVAVEPQPAPLGP